MQKNVFCQGIGMVIGESPQTFREKDKSLSHDVMRHPKLL
jgi:hypothetical protein